MCGRFTLHTERDVVAETFEVDLSAAGYEPRYNIAPQQDIITLIEEEAERRVRVMHWGLVPHWAKPLAKLPNMINARVETLADKPAYRDPFRKRRCAVVADGFFEWQGNDRGRPKQPFWIHRADRVPFAMAGIWDRWTAGASDQPPLISCAIVTAPANAALAGIHPRMPVILDSEALKEWLSRDNDDRGGRLRELLIPLAPELLASHPVSAEVNDVSNDAASLIQEYAPQQPSLF